MTPHLIPNRIFQKLARKMASRGFYSYAFVRAHSGPNCGQQVVGRFAELGIGALGELIAVHKSRAYKAIHRYQRTRSESSARTAADHIFRCNRYALRREELLGNRVACDSLPFPLEAPA